MRATETPSQSVRYSIQLIVRAPFRASRAAAPTYVGRKECLQMCDYSLGLVASRPAKVGDELVTTKFQNSLTRGFTTIGEPNVAVCLLPGTEVAFEKEVQYERFFSFLPNMKLGKKVARFRPIHMANQTSIPMTWSSPTW